ncbi:carbohydrate ABC transporter permease [Enterococcus diestrammenae]|uniref:carbohydrate ABC transporter permease n=1 Tax=Enterococcus diestrammenae TaxID=1155073 RepID=UPI0019591116
MKTQNTLSENMSHLKRKHINRESRTAWLFLLPGIVLLMLFVFWPIIYSLPLAFTNYSVIAEPAFVGLANFKKAFSDPDFIMSLVNSLIYVLIVPIMQIFSMLLANMVNQKIRGIKLFRTLYYIPVVTSTVAVSIIWSWLLSSNGLINAMLKMTGVISENIGWLTNKQTALATLMFITLWKGLGYYMMIYLAGLQSIPGELIEAAEMDGATKVQAFFKITMPLLRPQIVLCSLMSLMGALRVFDEPFVLTKGGPANSTMTSSLYIYKNGFEKFDFGYSAALGLIVSVIVILLSIVIFKYNKKAEEGMY